MSTFGFFMAVFCLYTVFARNKNEKTSKGVFHKTITFILLFVSVAFALIAFSR